MSVLSFLIQHKYNQESLVGIGFFLKTPVFESITASCAAWGVSGTPMVYFVIVIYRALGVGLERH